ncbi:MAG: GNAT family N-acetyltransferase [Mesonia hippocampi]|uniref:GNAT family N-acetyltransferase n=1 Tax=Mesonia hippocampi TaxID=1628250 RepID=UPI003F94E6CB
MNNFSIITVKTENELNKCWEVVKILRPNFKREKFLLYINEMMQEGYQIIAVTVNNEIAGYAGFRPMTTLHSGRIFYLDDLVTSSKYRKMGIGTKLLRQVYILAKEKNKEAITLDSSIDLTPAHRLYLNNRYAIVALHFKATIEA